MKTSQLGAISREQWLHRNPSQEQEEEAVEAEEATEDSEVWLARRTFCQVACTDVMAAR